MNKIMLLEKNCCGCFACYNVCKTSAIRMKYDDEGFFYPTIEKANCINCGRCEEVCPVLNFDAPTKNKIEKIYYGHILNESIRLDSSSGGVFSLLAGYVLDNSGIVVGAAYDNDWNIVHKIVFNRDGLYTIRGSKYVQSAINHVYQEVKKYVLQGRLVLFSGTTCQVEGLRRFLNTEYSNLLLVDLICHGVPSPMVWQEYISSISAGRNIEDIKFRSKNKGWKKFSLMIRYDNGKVYTNDLFTDVYLRGFLSNLYLRPSCHNCIFKTRVRNTDFTIADFWGIQSLHPDDDDDRGVSLLMLHSEKAINIFRNISNQMIYKEISFEKIKQYIPQITNSEKKHVHREKFFKKFRKHSVDIISLIDISLQITYWDRLKQKLNNIFVE